MRVSLTIVATGLALALAACSQQSRVPSSSLDPFAWGPAPEVFPPGAQMAVIQGNPSAPEPFTVRLRFPDGYRIPPHTHPTDEHVTVLEGALQLGMGESWDSRAMMRLNTGDFVTAPANHAHYVEAHGETVVQVHAVGPFALIPVGPSERARSESNR